MASSHSNSTHSAKQQTKHFPAGSRKRHHELTGRVIGHLTVIRACYNEKRHAAWECQCECGNIIVRETIALTRRMPTTSCGCGLAHAGNKRSETHGKCRTRVYRAWLSMRQRCEKEYSARWSSYGARGISVCERWQAFDNFYEDMGDPPDGMTLDRIDVNGNYEPGNCRWATKLEQSNNTRSNHLLIAFGEEKTMAEWARDPRCEVAYSCLKNRISRGWSPEAALTRSTTAWRKNL